MDRLFRCGLRRRGLRAVRVQRVVSALLAELGTPAKAPKPRRRSAGRTKGRLSGEALPGSQEDGLDPHEDREREFCKGLYVHHKTLVLRTQG